MVAVGDPVGTGIVASLARPGGNITGLSSIPADLEGKRLELLREVIPTLFHVAVFWNPASPYQVVAEKEVQAAAQVLRMKVLSLGMEAQEQFDNAFATIRRERPGALVVLGDRLFLHNRARIMDFAAQNHLPGMNACRELVEAGGLWRPERATGRARYERSLSQGCEGRARAVSSPPRKYHRSRPRDVQRFGRRFDCTTCSWQGSFPVWTRHPQPGR